MFDADCRVGPTAVTKLFVLMESWTVAVYADVDSQKVQTASRLPVVVDWVVRSTKQVIEEPDPVQVHFPLL